MNSTIEFHVTVKNNAIRMKSLKLYLYLTIISTSSIFGQSITVNAEDYQQVYEGGGVSIGLFIGHHFSMNAANEDKAIQLMAQDINMAYIQDYLGEYPDEKPSAFDNPTNYFKAIKAYRPESQMTVVLNSFPDNLLDANGNLDYTRVGIYDEVADWYFQVLQGFKDRDVEVSIINLVNEPDFNKQLYYGHGNSREGVSFLLKEAVPRLKTMLNDPMINVDGMIIPEVMAPSTLGTNACLNFINHFIDNHPDAWAQVDIVGTHQYGGALSTSNLAAIRSKLDGRKFVQSEQHADHQENNYLGLPSFVERPHRASLALFGLMAACINNGVSSWYYFINNYPNSYHSGGLMQVKWGGAPNPYRQYYSFKQLNSTQADDSNVLTNVLTEFDDIEVMSFRKMGEDTLYLHIGNFEGTEKQVTIDIQGLTNVYGIKSIKSWVCDAERDNELYYEVDYASSRNKDNYTLNPYSMHALKIVLDANGPDLNVMEQILTFSEIADRTIADPSIVNLAASTDSGLTPAFELISGPATLSGNELTITGVGMVEVKASQPGNDQYLSSNTVLQTIYVWPSSLPNIALNKNVTADSNNGDASNAVDGNNTDNASRWVSTNTEFPHWLEIDLGQPHNVSSFAFWTGFNGYTRPIYDFDFQIQLNGAWVPVVRESGNDNPIFLAGMGGVTTSKVRLYMNAASDNFARIYEVNVYGYPIPERPNSPTIQTLNDSVVKIDWEVSNTGEDGYILERSEEGGAFLEIVNSGNNVTSFEDNLLAEGTNYTYRIKAYNEFTETAYSETSSAITTLSIPELQTDSISDDFVELSWIDNSEQETGYYLDRRNQSGTYDRLSTITDGIHHLR